MTPAATPLVITDGRDAEVVAAMLRTHVRGPVGLDVETTGCDPRTESPVGRARVWSLQLAWFDEWEGVLQPVFIPAAQLGAFKPWLEDWSKPKVGSSIYSFDRHALANEGCQLQGVIGCTWGMSKLLCPAEFLDDGAGHGLKDWGKRLGYEIAEFRVLTSRPMPGALGAYKRDRVELDSGCRTVYTAGAEYQNIRWSEVELIQLPEIWERYPQRRQEIVNYACQDPCMSWDAYQHLHKALWNRPL